MQLRHSSIVLNFKHNPTLFKSVFFILLFFISLSVKAIVLGDFRSKQSGDWYNASTWEMLSGTNWIDAPVYPGEYAGPYSTEIQNTHVVKIYDTQIGNNIGNVTINGQLYLEGFNSSPGPQYYLKSMNILLAGSIYFFQKGNLNLPANSGIRVLPGGSILGDCSNNQTISIGGQPYAFCRGGGGSDDIFLFSEVVAAGGTFVAVPTSNSPVNSCNDIQLYGNYVGPIGSPVTYSWSVTDPSNAITPYNNQQNVTITSAQPGIYTATLTVSTTFNTVTYTNSQTIQVTVNNYSVWTGAIDTDWSKPGNWTCGVPTSLTEALIPAEPVNQPVVFPSAIYNALKLTIEDGAVVTINPGAALGVPLVVNNSGVNGIVIKGDLNLPSGSFGFLNGPSEPVVPATVIFWSKAFIDRSGQLPDYKWQYFGIPFTEYVPEWTLGDYKKKRWDETYAWDPSVSAYTNWKNVQMDETMLPVKGYAITQENADWYDIKGNLYNQPIVNYPLSYTTANGNDYAGMHILGNPYTAAIRISDISFDKMEESVGFYNTGSINDWTDNSGSSTYGNLAGQYLNIPKNQAGNNLPSSIPSMQGFLVKVDPTQFLVKRFSDGMQRVSAIGGSISIPYIPFQNAEPLRAKKDVQPVVSTIIDIRGENFGDRMWLFTNTNCTKDFDNGWDSRKIMGSNSAPQLFFVENDNKFQVSTVDDVNGSFLGFRKGIDNEYTMTFTHNNAELAYPNGIYLMDLVANKTVNVTESGSTYTFTVNGSSLAKASKVPAEAEVVRFKIVTTPGITTDINNIKNEIKVIVSEKSIIFDNQTEKQAQMTLFDVTGKVVMSSAVNAGVSSVNVNVPAGTYIVQVVADRTNIKSSIIIK